MLELDWRGIALLGDLGLNLMASAGIFLVCAVAALDRRLGAAATGEADMKIKAAPRILAVAGLCATILIGFVINEGAARASGQEVLLPVEGSIRATCSAVTTCSWRSIASLTPENNALPRSTGWNWTALRARGDIYAVAGGASSRAEVEQVGPVTV